MVVENKIFPGNSVETHCHPSILSFLAMHLNAMDMRSVASTHVRKILSKIETFMKLLQLAVTFKEQNGFADKISAFRETVPDSRRYDIMRYIKTSLMSLNNLRQLFERSKRRAWIMRDIGPTV